MSGTAGLHAALTRLPAFAALPPDALEPMPRRGVAHDHVRLAGRGLVARVPRWSQLGLDPAANLEQQAAAFRRAAPGGHTPELAAVLPPGPELARKAKELRAAGADLVVALTGNSGGTHRDVIASGAADIVLYQDRGRVVAVDYDGKTLNATVGPQAAWVLALDVSTETVTEDGAARTVWSSGVRAINTAAVPPDEALDARAKAYRARLDSMLGMQVGRLDSPIDTRREAARGGENAFANTVTDSLREAMGGDVALINGGSFRGDRAYAAGMVWTRRDIQTEFPFHDTAVLIEVTGQQLRDALEFGFSGIEELQGRFPHLSNARVTVDASRPPGQRVLTLTVGGKPVEPEARFRLATGSYLANGGDGYGMLSTAPRLVDDRDADFVSTILASRIARTGSFAPQLDGRLTIRR